MFSGPKIMKNYFRLSLLAVLLCFSKNTFASSINDITINVQGISWVELIDENGHEFLTKLMRKGETLTVNDSDKLFLSSGNAGGLSLKFSDGRVAQVGKIGEIIIDLPLNTASLRTKYFSNNCPEIQQVTQWSNCRGTYVTDNGGKYIGEFQKGKFDGRGIYTFPNGDRYEGEFASGVFHGKGKLYLANGSWSDGTFKDGVFHGNFNGYDITTNEYWTDDYTDGKQNRELEPKAEERAKVEVASVKNTNSGLSPEEIYYSALGIALAQDFTLANKAFEDFQKMHPNHTKSASALFWRGQMEFMNMKFVMPQ